MTARERRRQNRINASKSTGPRTDIGKCVSRANALKHGFTASVLSLPNENPEEFRIRREHFHAAFDPQSHDEDELVDQVATASLRLERIAKAENAMLAEQVRQAEIQWDMTQQLRVLDLTAKMHIDPARTLIELRGFSAGAEWIMERWLDLKKSFDVNHGIDTVGAMKDLLRLSGFHPDKVKDAPFEAYELVLRMHFCQHDVMTDNDLIAYRRDQWSPQWYARNLVPEYPREESQAWLEARINAEIAKTQDLLDVLRPIAKASREGAADRALMPADTKENRLFTRYRTSAEMSFNRAFKTLEKVQLDREKWAAKEVENEESRNEANPGGTSPAKLLSPGDYVKLNGGRYRVADMYLDRIVLKAKPQTMDIMDASMESPPKNGE